MASRPWRACCRQLADLLAKHDLLFVGLHVSVGELNRREQTRGDRPMGSAEADFHSVHQGLCYDLELDMEDSVEANADRVLAGWREPRRRSAFFDQPAAVAVQFAE